MAGNGFPNSDFVLAKLFEQVLHKTGKNMPK